MNFPEFLAALDAELHIHEYNAVDNALNGLQVASERATVNRVVTAVDASLEKITRSTTEGADCLFVHHGIFWGKERAVVGNHHLRIKALLAHNCALYAAHLPLDAHPALGNNIAIAEELGLRDITPFGAYHGVAIGYRGVLDRAHTIEEIQEKLLRRESAEPLSVLPFGREGCRTVAIVSGGGGSALAEAVAAGVDLFITGDANHTLYYEAQENNINVLSAGHYNTEIWGVRRVAGYINTQLGIEAEFIDLPTGL